MSAIRTRSCVALLLLSLMSFPPSLSAYAQEEAPKRSAPVARGPGGFGPFLQSCICGPRIGLESNEGKEVTNIEYANAVFRVIAPVQALGKTGVTGCMAACCIGPRVGLQLNERRIRTLEWLRLVPILNVYAAVVNGIEAGEGHTMGEIVEAERLQRAAATKRASPAAAKE